MKISKLLPITLALALGLTMSASYAEGEGGGGGQGAGVTAQGTPTSDPLLYQLTLPEYIKITSASTKQTAELTFQDDYEGFNYTGAMDATFTVVTNAPQKKVLLTASAGSSGSQQVNALSKDGTYIVFANTKTGSIPSDAQIQNATDSPAVASNPNCFGLTLTPGAATNTIGGAFDPTYTVVGDVKEGDSVDSSARALQASLTNGISTLPFTFGTSNDVTGTFSLHDTLGTYQATLTMTEVPL